MKFVCILLYCSAVVICSVSAQPDCEDLGFDGTATSAAELNYCSSLTGDQCCTNEYFTGRSRDISSMVTDEIRTELNRQVGSLGDIVDEMENYLRNTYIPRFSQSFCSDLLTDAQCTEAINDAEYDLLTHLYLREDEIEAQGTELEPGSLIFSTARVVSLYVQDVFAKLGEYYLEPLLDGGGTVSTEDKNCLFEDGVNSHERLRYIAENMTTIRRALTTLNHLRVHVNETILPDIVKDYTPRAACIDSFINARCEACQQDIPDNCKGACNALYYGCLAPFREGLMDQFNLLWSISGQILDKANSILPVLFELIPTAYKIDVNSDTAIRTLAEGCGLRLASGSTTPQITNNRTTSGDNTLPGIITETANRLLDSGAFNDTEPSACMMYENTNCWNGTANVTENNINFNSRTVAGQSNNPLASYNVTKLQEFAYSFDMFVTGYLRSNHFLDVAPEGLNLPFNYTANCTVDCDDVSAGSVSSIQILLLTFALIIGLLLLI